MLTALSSRASCLNRSHRLRTTALAAQLCMLCAVADSAMLLACAERVIMASPQRHDAGKVASSSSGSSTAKAAPQRSGCLASVNKAINGTIERAFQHLGRFIGRWPWLVIVIAIVVAAALGSGVYKIENETRCDASEQMRYA